MSDCFVVRSGTARKLVVASAAMLYLELALIRWIGENVLYVTYFTNFVLLAAFFGIGLGFLAGHREARWIKHLPYLLLGLVGAILVFPVRLDRSMSEVLLLGTGSTSGVPAWLLLPILFLAVTATMATIAQEVARLFAQFSPLEAYRLDILGSIAGVGLFTALSFVRSPPLVWGLVASGLVWIIAREVITGPRLVGLGGVVLVLALQTFSPNLTWSPYYELTVEERADIVSIGANGIPHQAMASVAALRSVDWLAGWPYEVRSDSSPPQRVLVIGAGSGNDVAYALDEEAERVDAVEIDPVIHELGAALHPDQPYSDGRVEVHVDDGRAFLQRSAGGYDLILFAVTDSLTLISGQSSLRLESYLFTTESVATAHSLLTEGGVLASYNLFDDDWLVARMADTMREATDGEVCAIRRGRGMMLAVGPGVDPTCGPGEIAPSGVLAPPTDDRPFLYVRSAGIPSIYTWSLALVLTLAAGGVRLVSGPIRGLQPYADLFLMGVAFLLLETKGVVQFALWFGTTWVVNALVFVGILVSVWLAIEIASRFEDRLSLNALYVLLFVSLAGSWSVPAEALLELPVLARYAAAVVLTFGPVFVANLVFAERFRNTATTTMAFGANLLGAMVGGVLEYTSLVVGHRNLVAVAALAYAGAFLVWRRIPPAPVPA